MPEQDLGNLLMSARIRAGFKPAVIARRLDVDPSTVSRWESGAITPPLQTIRTLRETYACRWSDLLGDDGSVQ